VERPRVFYTNVDVSRALLWTALQDAREEATRKVRERDEHR
jgi:hypothetical protein